MCNKKLRPFIVKVSVLGYFTLPRWSFSSRTTTCQIHALRILIVRVKDNNLEATGSD